MGSDTASSSDHPQCGKPSPYASQKKCDPAIASHYYSSSHTSNNENPPVLQGIWKHNHENSML